MKYIKRVILENFQSHKYTVIDFESRLNVIVGASDSGKTAILRGIRWALYNDPSGDYFIREGASQCSVTIVFSDNTKVKRYRSKNKNIYYLYDKFDNEFKFEGFGTSVPDEIIEATGIKKILLDKDISKSINISDQLEGAFLLSEKTSIRASSIGYLVGVDIIDDTLKETLRERRNLSNKKRNIDDSILKLENDLSKYDYLNELDRKVSNLEDTLNTLKDKEKLLIKYKDMLSKFSKMKSEKTRLEIYTEKFKGLDKIQMLLNEIEIVSIKYRLLSKQKKSLEELKLNKYKSNKILNSLRDINVIKENVDKISILDNKKTKLIKINIKNMKTSNEIKKYENIKGKLINSNKVKDAIVEIDFKTIQLNKLLKIKNKEDNIKKSLSIGYLYMDNFKGIDQALENHGKIEKNMAILNKLMERYLNYKTNKDMTIELNKKIEEYEDNFSDLSIEYKDMLLKEGTCPLCFSNIDDKKANYIISQYK